MSSEPDFGLGIAFALNQPMNSTLAEIVDQADVTTATNINVSADGLHDLDADAIGGAVSERFGRHQFECGTHRARSGTKCSTRRLPALWVRLRWSLTGDLDINSNHMAMIDAFSDSVALGEHAGGHQPGHCGWPRRDDGFAFSRCFVGR